MLERISQKTRKPAAVRRFGTLFLLFAALALLLCACNTGETASTGATATPAVDDAPLSPQPEATPTPGPAASDVPEASPTPAVTEYNVYVMGKPLSPRACLDADGSLVMVPLEEFATAAGITMENEAAKVTLDLPGGAHVVIDDIYSADSPCTVNDESGTLVLPFFSKNGVVYAPINLLTGWFGLEWAQNPVGDILVTPFVAPDDIANPAMEDVS